MKFTDIIVIGVIMSGIISQNSQAQYMFLGNVNSWEQEISGVILHCDNDVQLGIRFLHDSMFRVTLFRPDYHEPLLDYPLVKKEWEAVPLDYAEDDSTLTLSSSRITLIIEKSPCRLVVLDKAGNVINKDDPGMGIGWDGKEVRCWKTISPEERFFGLGEKTGNVNKRGREYVMWNSDTPGYSNQADPLYQSIPFFIGLREGNAYGIYLNNSYRTTFNMGAGNRRYYSFSADGGNLDYFFIYGPEIPRVVQLYSELTGKMPLPPLWALGYQQCRWSYYPEEEVRTLARTFREKKIPADVIYLDIHYMDGYRVFTWDKERFPDPEKMLNDLREMGFHVVTIIDPGVKVDSSYPVSREGVTGKHFLRYPDGTVYVGEVWPGPAFFPDFSHPATRRWWGRHLGRLLQQGVAGLWNDMNEPAVWGNAFPNEVLMHDNGLNSNMKKMHNLYGFLMSQTAYEAALKSQPNKRPFILTRAGFAGEQRFTAVWTGDNRSSWDHLALGIRMMLGLSLSGIPFVGTDVGGFMGDPTPELMVRWMQVGVFSPLFRNHTHWDTRDQEPWAFGETVEAMCREAIELRYRLLPYLYTLFQEASENGTPILRPLFWYHQEDPVVYETTFQEQFYVGEHLLVAPVVKEGERLKKVYLPEGKWLDWHSETVYEGGRTVVVEAPLERIPLFLRSGAIIPTRDPVQYVGEKPISTLYLDVFPGSDYGNFRLYEDDGESFDYLQGQYRLTQFEYLKEGDHLTFTINRVHDKHDPGERMLEIRFHTINRKPHRAHLDNRDLAEIAPTSDTEGFYYDATRHLLVVRFPDEPGEQVLSL
ncbi:MAG: DUF5110 domain-containing protein [Calditrichaeota bacterium]|nr:MAG: DUF5110 domain-containing protein [Calditrichota bacterium]